MKHQLLGPLLLLCLSACSLHLKHDVEQSDGVSKNATHEMDAPTPVIANNQTLETTTPAPVEDVPTIQTPETTPPTRKQETPTHQITQNPVVDSAPKLITPEPQMKPKTVSKLGRLQGNVDIVGKKNKSYRPSNVIVTLTPLKNTEFAQRGHATHRIDMRDKTYSPVVQTVLKGDKLEFNNHDDIKHNVFSSSGENTFDLGTFKGGSVRSVALNHTGIVKVYCNIHPEMATFVMVTEQEFNTVTNNKGEFEIKNIPEGEYQLNLWHIRGELKKNITITAEKVQTEDLEIDATGYQRVAHKNKFGKNYEKKPALFEDEFY